MNNDPEDDPLYKVETAFGELEEKQYKTELELVDRYQTFTAEILRLSLAGIAVFGFLYKIIFQDIASLKPPVNIGSVRELAAGGIVMFGISAACSLFFRFFATEGVRYYIEALRFVEQNEKRAKESLKKRYQNILWCRWLKRIAAVTLALGGVLTAISLCLCLLLIKS